MSISTTASHFPSIPNKPSNDLYAAIDMGTNSFKMLVVKADPTTGKFLKLNRLKSPVLLGQSTSPATRSTQCLTEHSQTNAISALNNFTDYLRCHQIDNYWAVATSAVREASNKEEFLERVKEEVGLDVEVLSGEEEGKYVYKGVLQFVPYYDKTVLCIDIGGGSTEFVVGNNGNVLFAKSLRLGHVTLSEKFVKNREILSMREYIRQVIEESGLVERVKGFGIEVVVGSSGTIRAMEKAVFHGYACGTGLIDEGFLFRESRRDWRFSREDLRGVVERLCGEEERIKRDGFFKRRSEFIVGGAVLLQEIFEVLGIEEMEVSDYALGEGVIAEKLAGVCGEYDLNVNAKWRSVMRFATRLNNKKRMKCAAQCAGIAKVSL